MGSSKSKDQVVEDEAEAMQEEEGLTDEQRALVIEEISKDMNILNEEVKNFPSLFSKNEAVALAMEDSDILVLRYSYLQSMDEICESLKRNIDGFPGSNIVIDDIKRGLTSLRSAKSLKEIQHFDSTKVVTVVDGRSVGIEVHYKIKAVQEDKWGLSLSFKDTSIKKNARVIVGYKYAAHKLNMEASKVPPTEDI